MNIPNVINFLKTCTLNELKNLLLELEKEFKIDTILESSNINNTTEIPSTLNKPVEAKLVDVYLTTYPTEKKISILKLIRTITGFGLKESKDIVDNVPKIIKEQITEVEANKLIEEFKTLGAELTLK